MPDLFVITGANGAGKSTLAKVLLPVELSELDVFDGDKLFVQKLAEIFPAKSRSPKYARIQAFDETVMAFESLVNHGLVIIPLPTKAISVPKLHGKPLSNSGKKGTVL